MNIAMMDTLKTVCTAGQASLGYIGDCNDQLDELVKDGLLDVAGQATARGPQRTYTPTQKGRELFKQLAGKGAGAA